MISLSSTGSTLERSAVVSAVILALAGAAWQPLAQDLRDRDFGSEIEVTLVNLDVYVRNDAGKPVRGLEASDFEVFEGDEPVEISHFFEVRPAAVARITPRSGGSNVAVASVARNKNANVVAPAGQRFAIFFDDSGGDFGFRARYLGDLEELASRMIAGGAAVTIFRFDVRLETLLWNTHEAGVVRGELRRLRKRTSSGNVTTNDRDNGVLEAMSEALSVLSGTPGRTSMLYVGLGQGLLVMHDREGSSQLPTIDGVRRASLDEVIDRANAAGITISSFDTHGLDIDWDVEAEFRSDQADLVDLQPTGMGTGAARRGRQVFHDRLAQETGGTVVRTSNAIGAAVEEVLADIDSYYSIGFEPIDSESGGARALKVRVKNPGFSVRHRSSLRARTDAERLIDQTAAGLFEEPGENDLEMGLEFGDVVKDGMARLLPMTVTVPLSRLLADPSDPTKVRCWVVVSVLDRYGALSRTVKFDVEAPTKGVNGEPLTGVRHSTTFRIEPGSIRIAVSVMDLYGGTTATVVVRREL